MKRAIFITSHKGGPGKSTFARALLDIMRTDGMIVAAMDADGSVGQLLQYHGKKDETGRYVPDPINSVFPFDIRNDNQKDNILNILATHGEKADVILVDMPGGTIGTLGDIDEYAGMSALVEEYQRHGYAITVVIVMSVVAASANNINKAVKTLGTDGISYIAVKNLFYGNEDEFALYDGFEDEQTGEQIGGKGKALLEQSGGVTITLPKLRGKEYALMDYYSLTFTDAAQSKRLKLAEKHKIYNWIKAFRQSIIPAKHLLGME